MIHFLQITFSTYHSHAQIPLIVPLCLIIFPTLYQAFKKKIPPKWVINKLSTKLIWLKLCNNQSIFLSHEHAIPKCVPLPVFPFLECLSHSLLFIWILFILPKCSSMMACIEFSPVISTHVKCSLISV